MNVILKSSLIVVVLLLSISIKAQDKPLEFGIKAGINVSRMSGNGGASKAVVGFKTGVTLDYTLKNEWYLLTELGYSLQGGKDDQMSLNLSYLQLPVHIGYKLQTNSRNSYIILHAGPYIGYAVSGQWKVGGISVDAFSDVMTSQNAGLKRFDCGFGMGVGLGFNKFLFDMGWDRGFINIYDFPSESMNNMNAHLTLGYKF